MTNYSQRDPRWARLELGSSKLTMGRYGCLVTCLAMLTTYFKPDHTPGDILPQLRFTSNGLLYWNSAVFENFVFYQRVRVRQDAVIKEHLRDPNLAVVLEVANSSHWVVATNWQTYPASIGIADPWLGDRASMLRYNNDITGAAYFSRRGPVR